MNRAERRKFIKDNKNQEFGTCPKCNQKTIYKHYENNLFECLKCGIVEVQEDE